MFIGIPLESLINLIVPVSLPSHPAALFSILYEKSRGDEKNQETLYTNSPNAVSTAACWEWYQAALLPVQNFQPRRRPRRRAAVPEHCHEKQAVLSASLEVQ